MLFQTFQETSVDELETAFKGSVDEYLDFQISHNPLYLKKILDVYEKVGHKDIFILNKE